MFRFSGYNGAIRCFKSLLDQRIKFIGLPIPVFSITLVEPKVEYRLHVRIHYIIPLAQWQFRGFRHGANGDARIHAGDTGQASKRFVVQPLEVSQVGNDDAQ